MSDPPPRIGKERFYSVRSDGTERRLLATFDWECCYTVRALLAFNEERDELIWTHEFRDGAGGTRGLYATNVGSGKTRALMPERNFAYHETAITADGSRFYYVKSKTRLIERDVLTRAERVIYRARSGEPALEFVRVTPDGAYVAFQATQQPVFDAQPRTSARTTTYRIDLSDGSRRTVYVESSRSQDHSILAGLSPDGRYAWFTLYDSGRGEDLMIDVNLRKQVVIADHGKQRAARFVAWIALPSRP